MLHSVSPMQHPRNIQRVLEPEMSHLHTWDATLRLLMFLLIYMKNSNFQAKLARMKQNETPETWKGMEIPSGIRI